MTITAHPIQWFEIAVTDLDRAMQFYEAALGYAITRQHMGPMAMGWFPMQRGAPGSAGTLVQAAGHTPSHTGTLVYFSVPNIDAALKSIGAAGGKTLLPKTDIGQYGFYAHFEDSEGNRIGLHERAPE